VTIAKSAMSFENPVGSTVVRDWLTGDVIKVYSNGGLYSEVGEIFSDPSKGRDIETGPPWPGSMPTVGLSAIKANIMLVTAVPYPTYNDDIARAVAKELGGTFVHIDATGLKFIDYHHVTRSGRAIVTETLLQSIP
jgi:hypothetical protein